MEFQFQMMDISSSGSSTNDVQQQQQQQQQNIDHLNMITNLNSPSASSGFSSICCGTGIIGGSSSSSSGGAGNNVGGSGGGGGVGCGGGGNAINSGTEIFPIAQQLVSTNSFELNVVTSLSDDSGVPLTNSSISSGDSYRLGLCKLELELVESDGEVSQFDSLEDSSDGGMSAENFNTLKKGPLAPIDPPPEFQDSPQTTMLRSKLIQNYAINLSEHVIVTALNDWLPPQQKIINLQDDDQIHIDDEFILSSLPFDHHNEIFQKKFLKNNISEINNHYNKHHIYASDSLLNKCYNIYDEPDDHLISSCENSLDNIIITTAAATESTKSKQKQKIEEFDNEYNNKNCSSKEYNTSKEKQSTKVDKNKSSTPQSDQHLEIYDYNFYYALKKNYQRESYYQQHKRTPSSVLYSPLHHNHHHHHHHHHHHSNSSNIPSLNRPNSRNSLNSRLSSSHNSLTVPNANKADDSIFITQAMSHDALLSREISDFYNVPIGADIYSFPIDMIKPSPQSSSSTTTTTVQGTETATKTTSTSIAQTKDYYNNKRDIGSNTTMTTTTTTINNISSGNAKISSSKGRFKNTRNKKRRRGGNSNNLINNETATGIDKYGNKIRPIMINASSITTTTNTTSSSSSKTPHKRHSVPENTITPLQMTLDEVKKFYHSLYSSTSDSNETLSHINITNNNNCNNNNNNINNNKNSHIKSSLNNDHTINFIHNTGTLGCSGGGSLAATTNYLNNTISTIPSSIGTSTSAAQTSSSAFNNATTKSVNLKNLSNEKNKYNNKSTAATTAALHIINKHDEIRNSSNNISGNNKYMITSTTGSIITQSPSAAATLNHQQQHQYHHHHQQQQNNHQIQQHHNQHHQNNQHNHHHHNNTTASEKKSQFFINLNLKQKFCSIFRFRKSNDNRRTNSSMFEPPDYISNNNNNNNSNNINTRSSSVAIVREDNNKFSSRALPPLPNKNSLQKGSKNNTYNRKDEKKSEFNSAIHFASNIEKVKDYGWYWGPISSEAAEKILSNEPDGSFIVRDSSDDHYIFSLSFKLNNCVRHVRIEQDQGTFSFGSYAKFKSQTITEFIEKAVEHSRSGRYLFFLHRRPEHGPMRVQLTNPVSRFKHIQSLQHMCRFVILKAVVRKDLIQNLPLPRRLLDYLSYKHCYSEQIECDSSSQSQSSGDGVV